MANKTAALSVKSHANKKTMAVWKPTKGEKAMNTANETENASLRGQRSFLRKEHTLLYIDLIIQFFHVSDPFYVPSILKL